MNSIQLAMAGMAEAPCMMFIMLIWLSLSGSLIFAFVSLANHGKITSALSLLSYFFCAVILHPWIYLFDSQPLGSVLDSSGTIDPDVTQWNRSFRQAAYVFLVISIFYAPVIIIAVKQCMVENKLEIEELDAEESTLPTTTVFNDIDDNSKNIPLR